METTNNCYILNTTTCYARKSQKGPGFLQQCPNKKKNGDYCGKHEDCTNPFTMLSNPKLNNIEQVVPITIKSPEAINIKTVDNEERVNKRNKKDIDLEFKFDKSRYQNKTDFFNFEDIETIPLEFFYEYQENNQWFAFDIRTLNDYIQSCNPLEPIRNPYTHVEFPKDKLDEIKKVHKKLSKSLNTTNYKDEVELSPEKQLEWRVLEVFQKINELGHYSEYKWFWDLNLVQLKRMYAELEDLWNYRLFLTTQQKQKILHGYFPFLQYTVGIFNKINILNDARKVLIGEIDKFVTMGKTEGKNGNDNKYTGSIIVLTALVQVSSNAANGLPHLVPVIE